MMHLVQISEVKVEKHIKAQNAWTMCRIKAVEYTEKYQTKSQFVSYVCVRVCVLSVG